jgi:hypothetical protein
MNNLRTSVVLPLVIAALVSDAVCAQLTCDQPLPSSLGVTPTAALLSFPAFQAPVPCQGTMTLHHAAYHRFTAPQDGWYVAYVTALGQDAWRPVVAVLESCASTQAVTVGQSQFGFPRCAAGDSTYRSYASAAFRMQAGQSRILVLGGDTPGDAGPAELRIDRLGDTIMDGAQPLALGANTFGIAGLEPPVPYEGACTDWTSDRMHTASRFSFTPATTGMYRFSMCDTSRYMMALSDSPNMPLATLLRTSGGCINWGGRLTAMLQAGTTYYLAAGYPNGPTDACSSKTATVEYIDPCPADFNEDDVTDGIDLGVLLAAWGTPVRDITGDGVTDGLDLGILLAMWGPCPE